MNITRDPDRAFENQSKKKLGTFDQQNAATDIWNALDLSVRDTKTLSSFKIGLSQAKA